jgi:hypothetical protein
MNAGTHSKASSTLALWALTLLLVAACGSRSDLGVYVTASESSTGSGGSASTGAGGAAAVGKACVNASDCLSPTSPCVTPACNAGFCGTKNVPKGTLIAKDLPADCGALACDGTGNSEQVVDFDDVPTADLECTSGACDANGKPSVTPVAAGESCNLPTGLGRCDGMGACVECLLTNDCSAGQACVTHVCRSATSVSSKCKIDQDCASDVCDPMALTCAPASCIDDRLDNSETDLDCGGGQCPGCYVGKKCNVNADCVTQKCDPTLKLCIGNACADKVRDGDETDVDCGGLTCTGCQLGQKCANNFDCDVGDCVQSTHTCEEP